MKDPSPSLRTNLSSSVVKALVIISAACISALPSGRSSAEERPVDLSNCRLVETVGVYLDAVPMSTPKACPFVTDQPIRVAQHHTVVLCGTEEICGKTWGLLADQGGRRFYALPSEYVVVEPQGESRDVPRRAWTPSRTGHGDCIAGQVKEPKGIPFYLLDNLDGRSPAVTDVVRLQEGTNYHICQRVGSFVLAYQQGRPGLLDASAMHLEPERIDASYLKDPGPFCFGLRWSAATTRPVFLYEIRGDGIRRSPEALRRDEPVTVLGLETGRGGRDSVWFHVHAKGKDGLLPIDSLQLLAGYQLHPPEIPGSFCQETSGKVRFRCETDLIPLGWTEPARTGRLPNTVRLGKGAELPLLSVGRQSAKVILFDSIAAVSMNDCVVVDTKESVELTMSPLRASRPVLDVPSDQQSMQDALIHRLPDVSFEAVPNPRLADLLSLVKQNVHTSQILDQRGAAFQFDSVPAATLVEFSVAGADHQLLRALFRGASGAEDLHDVLERVTRRLCPSSCNLDLAPETSPPGDKQSFSLPEELEAENIEGLILLEQGAFHEYIETYPTCFSQKCPPGPEALLMARALEGVELNNLAREAYVDLLGADPNLQAGMGAASLKGVRRMIRKTGATQRITDALRGLCNLSRSGNDGPFLRDLCILALQSSLDVGEHDEASRLLEHSTLLGGPPDFRIHEAQGRLSLAAGSPDGLISYLKAVDVALDRCPFHGEIVQKLLLQAARAAYSLNELSVAHVLQGYLLPQTMSEEFLLSVQILSSPRDFKRAQALMACAGGRDRYLRRSVEFALAAGFILTGNCQFDVAHRALLRATERLDKMTSVSKLLDGLVRDTSLMSDGSHHAGPLLKAIHDLLDSQEVSSRDLEEIDNALRGTGPCGRWWDLRREILELCSLADEVNLERPVHLVGNLQRLLDDLDQPCVVASLQATRLLRSRLVDLGVTTSLLMDDIRLVLESNLDAMKNMWAHFKQRARDNYCADLAAWAAGEDPDWINGIEDLRLPFEPFCVGEMSVTLTDGQRKRLSEATANGANLCRIKNKHRTRKDQGNTMLWTAVDDFLDERSMTALDCLIQAKRHGASETGLLLLVRRYLPGLLIVNHDQLDRLGAWTLPSELTALLRTIADGNSRLRGSLCVSGARD